MRIMVGAVPANGKKPCLDLTRTLNPTDVCLWANGLIE